MAATSPRTQQLGKPEPSSNFFLNKKFYSKRLILLFLHLFSGPQKNYTIYFETTVIFSPRWDGDVFGWGGDVFGVG